MRASLKVLILSAMMISAALAAQACAVPANADALRAEMLALVNAERARAGLARLSPAPRLDQAAQHVSCDNARRGRLSHTTADGSDLGGRLRTVGYRFRMGNENIAWNRSGPRAAVQSWMGSSGHRANLLDRQSREFGGAVAQAPSGQLFWTMVTAAAR